MPLRLVPLLSALLFATLAIAAACNIQFQGEICNPRNGNNDCQTGLVCTSSLPPGCLGARCCPQNIALATVPCCGATQATVDANTAAPSSTADAEEPSDSETPDTSDAPLADAGDASPADASDAASVTDGGDAAASDSSPE